MLVQASDEATPGAIAGIWRHDVPLEPSTAPMRVERLVLDSGRGLLNEAKLAARLREGLEAYVRCAADWGRLDGATGTLIATPGNGVRFGFDDAALRDEPCVAVVRDALNTFSPRHPPHPSMSIYRFRLGRARR